MLNKPGQEDAPGPNELPVAPSHDPQPVGATGSRIAAVVLGVVAAALFIGSISVGVAPRLPAIGLGWVFGVQVLRAAELLVVIAAVGLLVVRGWNGRWPTRVSTSGFEFEQIGKATEELERGAHLALEVTRELLAEREAREP